MPEEFSTTGEAQMGVHSLHLLFLLYDYIPKKIPGKARTRTELVPRNIGKIKLIMSGLLEHTVYTYFWDNQPFSPDSTY